MLHDVTHTFWSENRVQDCAVLPVAGAKRAVDKLFIVFAQEVSFRSKEISIRHVVMAILHAESGRTSHIHGSIATPCVWSSISRSAGGLQADDVLVDGLVVPKSQCGEQQCEERVGGSPQFGWVFDSSTAGQKDQKIPHSH